MVSSNGKKVEEYNIEEIRKKNGDDSLRIHKIILDILNKLEKGRSVKITINATGWEGIKNVEITDYRNFQTANMNNFIEFNAKL